MASGQGLNQSNIEGTIICYAPNMITTNGIWQGDNPLDYSLPLFILQLTLIVSVTRTLVYLLKPFRQPRVIAEILGGLLLGPSVLGRIHSISSVLFPLRSVMVLETMANVGLLYFLFLVGVEMDIDVIRRTGKKAFVIAVAGMILPFLIGAAFSFLMREESQDLTQGTFILFLGVCLSVTAFPVLARILAELKLLNTDVGRLAMSSAIINDICAWVLLALAIALSENKTMTLASIWVLVSSVAFVGFSVFVLRPSICSLMKRTPEGEAISDFHICLILTGVMICGFITDAIGTHSVFGAFVFGLIIPNGPLGVTLIERLEDFVSGLLLPLFFATSGLKTEIQTINHIQAWGILTVIGILACAGKVAGTLLASLYYKMPLSEGLALGLLMNTKGIVEMIILNVGVDQKVLDEKTFATMVLVAVVMTTMIVPSVTLIYKPARRLVPYKTRTVQRSKPDSEFRVLVCIHTPRNVPTIINLIEATNPTKKSPICIYVLHLVELTGRASTMLVAQNARKPAQHQALNRTQAQSDHIINAFENFERHCSCVAVQTLSAMSPYSTIHEDICRIAEEKRASLVIIPFHKQQTVDGGMEATNPSFRSINRNLLEHAPCSVGILVDRGLTGSTRIRTGPYSTHHHVLVLFFRGPDDREALAYGWRMSEHPGVRLTVIRFISDNYEGSYSDSKSTGSTSNSSKYDNSSVGESSRSSNTSHSGAGAGEPEILTVRTDNSVDRERMLDEDYLNEFRTRTGNNDSISYTERLVRNGEETVSYIRALDTVHDLYIVGKGQKLSPLTAGLTEWSECPELGAIGDILAASDFASAGSVLVVKQYVGKGVDVHGDEYGCDTPEVITPTDQHRNYFAQNNRWTPPHKDQSMYHSQP